MWLRKKEIFIQIERHEKNTEFLIEFAHYAKKRRVQDTTIEDVKGFYKQRIEPQASTYFRLQEVKFLNKFLRAYGVPIILSTDEVVEITPNDAIIEAMKTVSKFNPTPKTRRNRRIVELKDKGWSYSEICAEVGLRSKSNVHDIYWREKSRSRLSTPK